jgi:hypothetical protein
MRTRDATVHLTGPTPITVIFGQDQGGAGLEFEWKGMGQSKWTRRLGVFTPLDTPSLPPPSGMKALKFDGYFDDDFDFPAFKAAPTSDKTLREIKLKKEGDRYSYLIMGMFHPPTVPGDYEFRTRSDDASYIIVNGALVVDDGNEHGMRTRGATVHVTGPVPITIIFGQNQGGAGLEFEWRGMARTSGRGAWGSSPRSRTRPCLRRPACARRSSMATSTTTSISPPSRPRRRRRRRSARSSSGRKATTTPT